MNRVSLPPILAPLAGAVLCLAFIPWPIAAGRGPVIEQFEARAVSVAGDEDAGRIGIYIERWSSDQELDSLAAPLTNGDIVKVLEVLRKPRSRVGVVLMPGVQAHGARTRMRTPKNLLFAREIDTPSGRRVILASDEHLGLGESQLDARKERYEFSVIDIRFGPDGTGVGKVATAAVYDPATKRIEVKNYETLPVRLIDVKGERF